MPSIHRLLSNNLNEKVEFICKEVIDVELTTFLCGWAELYQLQTATQQNNKTKPNKKQTTKKKCRSGNLKSQEFEVSYPKVVDNYPHL